MAEMITAAELAAKVAAAEAAPRAHHIEVASCPDGCAVLVLYDSANRALLTAHGPPEVMPALFADMKRSARAGSAWAGDVAGRA